MLKKLLFLTCFCPLLAFAGKLPTYQSVVHAIGHGKRIKVVLNFSKCNIPENKNISAFFVPSAIMILNKTVNFSETHFTLNSPQFPNQPTLEFITYKLKQNGNLVMKISYLDPKTYKAKGQQPLSIRCKLGTGAFFY